MSIRVWTEFWENVNLNPSLVIDIQNTHTYIYKSSCEWTSVVYCLLAEASDAMQFEYNSVITIKKQKDLATLSKKIEYNDIIYYTPAPE